MQVATRRCPRCRNIVLGHPNKKFCGTKCKDRYHNDNNPRGKFAHLHPDSEYMKQKEKEFALDAMEAGWDGHKTWG